MSLIRKRRGAFGSNARGFGMIEVLVTMVVFAVGVLGVAALQGASKRSQHDAIQRTTATVLIYDIIERMRANSNALGQYVGNPTVSSQPACNDGTTCTAQTMASYDLWQWQQALSGAGVTRVDAGGNVVNAGGLVNPTGCITGPATGGQGSYTVSIAWRGNSDLNDTTGNTCGTGSGLYGANDQFRRVVSIQVYITPTNTGTNI